MCGSFHPCHSVSGGEMEGAADGVLVGRGCYSGTPPIVSQNTAVCVWRAGGITRPAGIRAAGCSIATCVSQATCCCLWDAWGVLLVYLFLHACIQPLPRGTGWPHSWMAVISFASRLCLLLPFSSVSAGPGCCRGWLSLGSLLQAMAHSGTAIISCSAV